MTRFSPFCTKCLFFSKKSNVPRHTLPQPASTASVRNADTHLCETSLASSCYQKATSKSHLCDTGGDPVVCHRTRSPWAIPMDGRVKRGQVLPTNYTALSLSPLGLSVCLRDDWKCICTEGNSCFDKWPTQFYRAYSKRN